MRRQKMKMGTCSALRKVACTVGNGVEIIRASRSRHRNAATTAERYTKHESNSTQVGKDETDAFQRQQDALAERSLPHLLRVKKTVGLHETVAIWYELSSDQDEFLTELQLAHPAPTRRLQGS